MDHPGAMRRGKGFGDGAAPAANLGQGGSFLDQALAQGLALHELQRHVGTAFVSPT